MGQAHPRYEGFKAMKQALRQDPHTLYRLLAARKEDLNAELRHAAEDGMAARTAELSYAVEKIDRAMARLERKADEAGQSVGSVASASDTDVAMPKKKSRTVGFGFAPRKETSTGPDPNNPVAMNGRIRREMGSHAADFLDEYAQAIHERVLTFLNDIKTRALDLGTEDDTDGMTTLREALRDQIGRRGLMAVEPLFDEWRQAVFKTIAREIKDMFTTEPTAEDAPALEDEQVGQLLGLDEDFMEEETPEEGAEEAEAAPEPKPAPAEAPAPKSPPETTSAASQPLQIARGPVSLRIGTKSPVSASAAHQPAQKARDFIPSGFTTPRLD